MLDMGFRPVVDRIVKMTAKDRQTLLFSATLAGRGRAHRQGLHDQPAPSRARRTRRSASAEVKVEHRFVSVSHEGKVARLVSELKRL